MRVFVSKGFNDAEDLADETINRVITRLPDIRQNYDGEPTRYFHGVARNIIRETGRRREIASEVSGVWIDPRPTSTTTLHFRTSVARLRKSITCNAIWQAVFY